MASMLNKRPSKTQIRKYFSMISIYKMCNLLLQELFLLQFFKAHRLKIRNNQNYNGKNLEKRKR